MVVGASEADEVADRTTPSAALLPNALLHTIPATSRLEQNKASQYLPPFLGSASSFLSRWGSETTTYKLYLSVSFPSSIPMQLAAISKILDVAILSIVGAAVLLCVLLHCTA